MRLCGIVIVVVAVVVMGVVGVGVAENKFEIIIDNYLIVDFAFEEDDIWCATSGGMIKFNKTDKSVIHYTETNGLIENAGAYFCVAIDHDGIVWCGTDIGISMFDGGKWNNFNRKDNQMWGSINDTAIDNENIKWFVSTFGVIMLNGSEWKRFVSLAFSHVFIDFHDTKWFTGYGRRAKYDDNGMKYFDDESYDFRYHCVVIDYNDVQFWGGGGDGLRVVNGDNVVTYKHIETEALAVDDNNVVWIGANDGLWKYENEKFSHVVNFDLFQNDYHEIWDIEIDNDGSVWLAIEKTKRGGIDGVLAKYTPDRTSTAVQSTQPEILSIIENYPNPFNAQTTLAFELPSESMAILAVYDITGRKVRTG